MVFSELRYKVCNRIWAFVVRKFRNKSFYVKIYNSYWHYRLNSKKTSDKSLNYYCNIPNSGAGIGHQIANWTAGYWFAQQFGLQFAHFPFSTEKWENFLGFGEKEINIEKLLSLGYSKVKLPLFKEYNATEFELQKKIIASYSNKKVVFVAEQDQFYRNQFGVIEFIQEKFHNAPSRKKNQLIYNPNHFNIAVHVRRGDIVSGQKNQNLNLQMRWQGNNYFEKVLANVLSTIRTDKPISIYLFSQGLPSDFPEFDKFRNLHFCLDMNAQDTFLHMVFADLLITSKSSFSYKPALLNRGIKVCPKDFWHGYPETDDWALVDEDGNINYKAV
jgi:hypothetical protein